jgi:tripartite-type tricarboxylate transporter receptor subunit TctC
MKKIILIGLLSLGLLVSLHSSLVAADYPKKPVKLIINFSAGGTTDTAARLMVSKAAEIVGQALV